jgi:hypothetical protein
MSCSLSRPVDGLFVVLLIIVPVDGLFWPQGLQVLVQEQLIAVLFSALLLEVV